MSFISFAGPLSRPRAFTESAVAVEHACRHALAAQAGSLVVAPGGRS